MDQHLVDPATLEAAVLDRTLPIEARLEAAESLCGSDRARGVAVLSRLAGQRNLAKANLVPVLRTLSRWAPQNSIAPLRTAIESLRRGDPHRMELVTLFCDLDIEQGIDALRDTMGTSGSPYSMQALTVLSLMDRTKAARALAAVVDTASITIPVRVAAAETLSGVDGAVAAEILVKVGGDVSTNTGLRLDLLTILCDLDAVRGVALLRELVVGPGSYDHMHITASERLSRWDKAEGIRLLRGIVADTERYPASRGQAAEALARLGDPQGEEYLSATASDAELDISTRIQAAARLGKSDPAAAVKFLSGFADAVHVTPAAKVEAAMTLTGIDEAMGVAALTGMAADPSFHVDAADKATRFLAAHYPPTQLEVLLARATDGRHVVSRRILDAEVLSTRDRHLHGRAMEHFITDSTLADDDRHQAAKALLATAPQRCYLASRKVVADPRESIGLRAKLAAILADKDPDDSGLALRTVASDGRLTPHYRRKLAAWR